VRTKLGYNDIGIIEPDVLSVTPSYAREISLTLFEKSNERNLSSV
jgi:hypothetical protein